MYTYFHPIKWKLQTLVVGGWDGLHGMDPWTTKKEVIWKVQIKDMECGVLYNRANLNWKINNSFKVSFCIVICFDGDNLVAQVNMGVAYLFYELQCTKIKGRAIIYRTLFTLHQATRTPQCEGDSYDSNRCKA